MKATGNGGLPSPKSRSASLSLPVQTPGLPVGGLAEASPGVSVDNQLLSDLGGAWR